MNIIGFLAYLHQPHPDITNLKRVSRLVILPDYQGIGLGTAFLNVIAERLKAEGFYLSIVTSAKNMINALRRSNKWRMVGYDMMIGKHTKIIALNPTVRRVPTGRFRYK